MVTRLVRGIIVEDFEQFDQLGLFLAIGKLPATAATA
jgi:hypothetical protein